MIFSVEYRKIENGLPSKVNERRLFNTSCLVANGVTLYIDRKIFTMYVSLMPIITRGELRKLARDRRNPR